MACSPGKGFSNTLVIPGVSTPAANVSSKLSSSKKRVAECTPATHRRVMKGRKLFNGDGEEKDPNVETRSEPASEQRDQYTASGSSSSSEAPSSSEQESEDDDDEDGDSSARAERLAQDYKRWARSEGVVDSLIKHSRSQDDGDLFLKSAMAAAGTRWVHGRCRE